MEQGSESQRPKASSHWLRTGVLPPVRRPDGIELKFNPWHDPADGRFTFAGSGHYHGAGGGKPANRALGRLKRNKPQSAAAPNAKAGSAKQPVTSSQRPESHTTTGTRVKRAPASQAGGPPRPAVEFIGGVGDGVYDVAESAITGVYSVLTTNPITTAGNVGHGIASMIDTVIDAEETPAAVQFSRAADAVVNASARDLGRVTGSIVGNVVLAVPPGAALGKVAALRRLREAELRPTYDHPEIGWVKEKQKSGKDWVLYNDTATGARPGRAPTLTRTMPDGSRRPVKFDGFEGEYMIDRKWSVSGRPRFVAQMKRQSEVLRQHRLMGAWEVPNEGERVATINLFKKHGITNIRVRIVKP